MYVKMYDCVNKMVNRCHPRSRNMYALSIFAYDRYKGTFEIKDIE